MRTRFSILLLLCLVFLCTGCRESGPQDAPSPEKSGDAAEVTCCQEAPLVEEQKTTVDASEPDVDEEDPSGDADEAELDDFDFDANVEQTETLPEAVEGLLSQAKARSDQAKLYVAAMRTPLDCYYLHHGKYPETSQGLDALIFPPNDVDPAKGEWPYVTRNAIQLDPWDQPYNYQYPGTNLPEKYDLWSSGPDRVSGTDDDIGNWN